MNDPTLAERADTTKQQIFKLRKGDRKLTVEWARRLAPHLRMGWQELIEGPVPAPALAGYGQRIAAARLEREQTQEEFAVELGVPVEMVRLWEASALAPDVAALGKLRQAGISADWVLFGDRGASAPRGAPHAPKPVPAPRAGARGRK